MHLEGSRTSASDFMTWLRRREPTKTPVLLMTASEDAPTLVGALGANGYLSKPFDLSTLINKVKSIVLL
jgi:DNA-binding response OmpR family regulator